MAVLLEAGKHLLSRAGFRRGYTIFPLQWLEDISHIVARHRHRYTVCIVGRKYNTRGLSSVSRVLVVAPLDSLRGGTVL